MSLTEYLDKVSAFWESDAASLTCHRCEMYEGEGYCAMLHDRSIPNGDCLGLLEIEDAKQPPEYDGPLNPRAAWPFPRKRP